MYNLNHKFMSKKKKEKKYSEFEKTYPQQLDLFSFSNIFESKKEKYSNTVDLYDTMPKYYHGDVEKIRKDGKYIDIISRDFVFKKQQMIINIYPARILQKNKESKDFLPSQREEIIEDVLRKFATDPNRNEFLDDRLSVKFSLYDLWKELRAIKHPYDYCEIKESLEILSKTNIEVKTINGRATFASNMFETFGVVNDNDNIIDFEDNIDDHQNDDYSKKIIYFVRFNSLVSESIKNKTWKILNYEQCMKYKKVISRWLHKRISHMFLTNDIKLPFNILLSTIIRDSGMTEYGRITNSIIQIQKCLAEMMEVGSIDRYDMEKLYSKERKNKIVDVKFFIFVSSSFYEDMRLNYLTIQENDKVKKVISLNTNSKNVLESEKNDLKDLLEPFGLTNEDINKILSFRKNKTLDDIKINILSAINYIRSEETKGKSFSVMAIIMSSLNNNWNSTCENIDDDNEEKTEQSNNQSLNNILSSIKNNKYRNISEKLIDYFGNNIYLAWLSKLEFVNIKSTVLTLSCNNQFVIDVIKRDYLNGIQKTDEYGKKFWYRKGIKQVVNDVLPKITDIVIEYKQ